MTKSPKPIIIFDFGSQTCHLISRRLKNLGLPTRILDPETPLSQIKKLRPAGLILSGGPQSVYQKNAPTITPKIFNLGLPILGICYGWQLTAHLLGGQVKPAQPEYGPQRLTLHSSSPLTRALPRSFTVWLSHGDSVVRLPPGFKTLGSTPRLPTAFAFHPKKQIFGVQFHPEVSHTQHGLVLLKNFARLCGLQPQSFRFRLDTLIKKIKKQVGSATVIAAVSGGVDSTTTAALVARAIGPRLIPIYIENGLMRPTTLALVKTIFRQTIPAPLRIVRAKTLFLQKLKGVSSPEKKRQIIGHLYIRLFEKEAKKIPHARFLAQGTIYSDVIESRGTQKAAKIKSHHNVAGLPRRLKLKLLEPLRYYYKDEVRQIALALGLPRSLVFQQPFPGPGQAIRIIGPVTPRRLRLQQQADQILLEELKKAGWFSKVFQSFPILTGIKSTAVKGDGRCYGEVIALRIYQSQDIMTADWARLPPSLLQKISTRLVNELPGISRVVYDITTKPPATMEWQ